MSSSSGWSPSEEKHRAQLPIRAVLFDLDNTLYDHDPAFEAWANHFVATHFPAEQQVRLTRVLQQMIALDATGKQSHAELFTRLKTLFPSLPPEVDELCYAFYMRWLEQMTLTEDAMHLLNALDAAQIPFGIITNGPVQQNLKLDRLGLSARAKCIFISAVFGTHKPDPAIFRAAAEALNLSCEQILFVGDSPEADICGAKGVGMQTAWLHRGGSWPASLTRYTPDFHLDSLNQLFPLLNLVP